MVLLGSFSSLQCLGKVLKSSSFALRATTFPPQAKQPHRCTKIGETIHHYKTGAAKTLGIPFLRNYSYANRNSRELNTTPYPTTRKCRCTKIWDHFVTQKIHLPPSAETPYTLPTHTHKPAPTNTPKPPVGTAYSHRRPQVPTSLTPNRVPGALPPHPPLPALSPPNQPRFGGSARSPSALTYTILFSIFTLTHKR